MLKKSKLNQGKGSSPVKPAWLSTGLAQLNPSFKGPESKGCCVPAHPTVHRALWG